MTTAAPVPQASASIVWMHSVAPPAQSSVLRVP